VSRVIESAVKTLVASTSSAYCRIDDVFVDIRYTARCRLKVSCSPKCFVGILNFLTSSPLRVV
jgi:hypothetical protein